MEGSIEFPADLKPNELDQHPDTEPRVALHVERTFITSLDRTCCADGLIGRFIRELFKSDEISLRSCILVRKLPPCPGSDEYPDAAFGEYEPIGANIRLGKPFAAYPSYFRSGETTTLIVTSGGGATRLSAWITSPRTLNSDKYLSEGKEDDGFGQNRTPFVTLARKNELFKSVCPDELLPMCVHTGLPINITDDKEFVIYVNNHGHESVHSRKGLTDHFNLVKPAFVDMYSQYVLTSDEHASVLDQLDATASEQYVVSAKKRSKQQWRARTVIRAEKMRQVVVLAAVGKWTEALLMITDDLNVSVRADTSKYGTVALLHVACYVGKLSVVTMLIRKKAVMNQVDARGSTPAGIAAALGHVKILDELLKAGADAKHAAFARVPALFSVEVQRRPSMVARLARHGADVNEERNDIDFSENKPNTEHLTFSVFQSVLKQRDFNKKYVQTARILMDYAADPLMMTDLIPVLYSVASCDDDVLRMILKKGVNPNEVTTFFIPSAQEYECKMTPLLTALCDHAIRDDMVTCDTLMKKRADINFEIDGVPLIAQFISVVKSGDDWRPEMQWIVEQRGVKFGYRYPDNKTLSEKAEERNLGISDIIRPYELRAAERKIKKPPAKRRRIEKPEAVAAEIEESEESDDESDTSDESDEEEEVEEEESESSKESESDGDEESKEIEKPEPEDTSADLLGEADKTMDGLDYNLSYFI